MAARQEAAGLKLLYASLMPPIMIVSMSIDGKRYQCYTHKNEVITVERCGTNALDEEDFLCTTDHTHLPILVSLYLGGIEHALMFCDVEFVKDGKPSLKDSYSEIQCHALYETAEAAVRIALPAVRKEAEPTAVRKEAEPTADRADESEQTAARTDESEQTADRADESEPTADRADESEQTGARTDEFEQTAAEMQGVRLRLPKNSWVIPDPQPQAIRRFQPHGTVRRLCHYYIGLMLIIVLMALFIILLAKIFGFQ